MRTLLMWLLMGGLGAAQTLVGQVSGLPQAAAETRSLDLRLLRFEQ